MTRQSAILATATFTVAVLAATAVAGCAPSMMIPRPMPGECPSHFTAAVAWSSPTSRASRIQFFDDGQLVGETQIPVQGLSTSDQTPLHNAGTVSLFSTGDAAHDESNIVTIELATCAVTLTRLRDDIPFNIALAKDGYISISNLNQVSYLREYRMGSDNVMQKADLDHELVTAAAVFGERVYAKSESWVSGKSSIIVFRSDGLTRVGQVDLPSVAPGSGGNSIAIASNKLIVPVPLKDGGEAADSRLIVVELGSSTAHALDLKRPFPFDVRAIGDTLYVAHTFLNPGFQPMSEYRHVSVLDMRDESVVGHDLQAGVRRIDVNSETFAALGEDDDGTPVLHTYTLPSFDLSAKVRLTPPSGVPDAYAATVFVVQS